MPSAGEKNIRVRPSAGQKNIPMMPSAGEKNILTMPSASERNILTMPSASEKNILMMPNAGGCQVPSVEGETPKRRSLGSSSVSRAIAHSSRGLVRFDSF